MLHFMCNKISKWQINFAVHHINSKFDTTENYKTALLGFFSLSLVCKGLEDAEQQPTPFPWSFYGMHCTCFCGE